MKLRKIFAGMAASAIALSTMAVASVTASADTTVTGKAGIAFQTDGTWNFRNLNGSDTSDFPVPAAFPETIVGVQGGGSGFDTALTCTDTEINGNGTYTVSIATSGVINSNAQVYDDGTERSGDALKWSMLKNYEVEDDKVVENPTKKFNMLLITTDIPCEYDDDDQPVINGNVVKVSDLTVDMCGTTYESEDGDVYFKSDEDYLTIAIINAYADSTIDASAMPAADGTITAKFTVDFGAGSGSDDNNSSTANSSTAGNDSSSTSSTGSTTSTTGTTKTGTNNAGGTTAAAGGSDATDTQAATGATAGLVFAGIALAGAAVVISKRK